MKVSKGFSSVDENVPTVAPAAWLSATVAEESVTDDGAAGTFDQPGLGLDKIVQFDDPSGSRP